MAMAMDFSAMPLHFNPLSLLPKPNLSAHSSADRLSRLRKLVADRGLQGYLIVDSDAHYTFYSQARKDRRINYITRSEVLFLVTL
jgi:hypothetical protein